MKPVGHGPVPEFPPFDAGVLADWLGAPVAMLRRPPGRLHTASNESHSLGHAPQIPVAVTVEHRMDSDDPRDTGPATMIHVRTRLRQATGEPADVTARDNLAQAVVSYQEDSAGRSGIPLRPSARPATLDEYLRRELDGWRPREVLADDAAHSFECVDIQDYATEEQLLALGGHVADTLVAVVGPQLLLREHVELVLVHPH